LRHQERARQLIFNFDFVRSNAERLPAAVLALSRFLVDAQTRKLAPSAENFETNQLLPLSFAGEFEVRTEDGSSRIAKAGSVLRAPLQTGFFSVNHEGAELLQGAARFGDPREADFRDATTSVTRLNRTRLIPRENLEPDRWTNLWLALIAAALVGSWMVHNQMRQA
jgi:hypothetical protein